jgi:muramoyltetrapeptide carboxypeptidase
MNLLKPQPLRPGDTIGVVVPAGPVNRERIERALERVTSRGYRVKTYGDLYRATGYLAGDDATRAAELLAAFADPETTAVWCARGGYGVVRLLERLDFDLIRRHPKVFIGFSDITALHLAIQQRAGLVTFHGPNLQDGFGKPDDMPAATEAALWNIISAQDQLEHSIAATPTGRRPSAPSNYHVAGINGVALTVIASGAAVGPLTGGNLAVLCGLMGTPYEIETAGRILFLEDVSERLYRIDRYLAQLTLAGKLQAAAGVLLGSFSYDDDEPAEPPEDVARLLDDYLGRLNVPVLAGFPAGHARWNLTLPIGAAVRLDADAGNVSLVESPVA